MEKTLIVVAGIPGSGKTTFAEFLKAHMGGEVVCTDDWFMKEGEYQFDITKLGQAHLETREYLKELIGGGVSPLIFANTNTQTWEFHDIVKCAEDHGYQVFPIVMRRNKEQAFESLHGVPEDTISRMQERLLWDLKTPNIKR
jgi:broad-specificity NMP kinase